MDEATEKEMTEALKGYEKRIREASTDDEKRALTAEAMAFIQSAGVTVPVESLEVTARFAAHVVDTVLASIVKTASEMGSDMVPVGFIEALRPSMPEYITRSLLKAADEIGVPLGFQGGVPDDLSELDA